MSPVRAPLEGGSFIKAKDHLGHLVFFTEVHTVEKRYDEKRKAEGEVLTLDWVCFMCHGGPNAEIQERAMISNPYVVNKIHRDNPSLTLGYIVQLEGKGGNEGAIVLNSPNDVDIQRATQWWETHKPSIVNTPVGATEATDPWAAPAQQQPANAGWGDLPPQQPPAQSSYQGWGDAAPANAQGGTGAPTPPAAAPPTGATAAPTNPTFAAGLDEATLRAMPAQAVQALVVQGMVTREAAKAAGHNF